MTKGADLAGEGPPCLIAVDWGTTSLRCRLLDANGVVLAAADAPDGILARGERDFADILHSHAGAWMAVHDVPVLLSGMIGSRNGWLETPYIATPAGSSEIARALVPLRLDGSRIVHFAPGLQHVDGSLIEVMRGEETQIVGAFDGGDAGDGLFVLPGTHSKWARAENGLITRFATFMTGDVFSALLDGTILRTLPPPQPLGDEFARDAFLRGVDAGLAPDCALLGALFQIRTQTLFGALPPEHGADYLSGLLIGCEIRSGLARHGDAQAIIIVGSGALARRYAAAFARVGREVRRAQPDVAAYGALIIAKEAGLIP